MLLLHEQGPAADRAREAAAQSGESESIDLDLLPDWSLAL